MSNRAMRVRMYNLWTTEPSGESYLLMSSSSLYDIQQVQMTDGGDLVTENDVWIEIPGRPSP